MSRAIRTIACLDATSLWLALWWLLYADTGTVPGRLRAIQKNWPSDKNSNLGTIVTVIGIVIAAATVITVVIYAIHKLSAHNKAGKSTMDIASGAGLTENEMKLLQVISSSSRKADLRKLLTSALQFDETVGAYLKRYCARAEDPDHFLSAVASIRNKLGRSMVYPAARLSGLKKLPLMKPVEVRNLSREGGSGFDAQVIEKQADHLYIVSQNRSSLLNWQKGDEIRIKGHDEEERDLEFLVRFANLESQAAGMGLMTADYPPQSVIHSRKDKPAPVLYTRIEYSGGSSDGQIEWMDSEKGHLMSNDPFRAGEVVKISYDSSSPAQGPLKGKVIYCYPSSREGRYEMGLEFPELAYQAEEDFQSRQAKAKAR
jgi:hypothetical protein